MHGRRRQKTVSWPKASEPVSLGEEGAEKPQLRSTANSEGDWRCSLQRFYCNVYDQV